MQRTGFQLSFTDSYEFAMPTAEKAVVEPQVELKHGTDQAGVSQRL